MSVQPEMPFKYRGMDVEALGHLVSARVVEMLEPIIRRLIWDAICEQVGPEEMNTPVVNEKSASKTLSGFICFPEFHKDETKAFRMKGLWEMFKDHCDINEFDLNPSSYGKFCGQVKALGYKIESHNNETVVVGLSHQSVRESA